jgi:hypothetical protein
MNTILFIVLFVFVPGYHNPSGDGASLREVAIISGGAIGLFIVFLALLGLVGYLWDKLTELPKKPEIGQ